MCIHKGYRVRLLPCAALYICSSRPDSRQSVESNVRWHECICFMLGTSPEMLDENNIHKTFRCAIFCVCVVLASVYFGCQSGVFCKKHTRFSIRFSWERRAASNAIRCTYEGWGGGWKRYAGRICMHSLRKDGCGAQCTGWAPPKSCRARGCKSRKYTRNHGRVKKFRYQRQRIVSRVPMYAQYYGILELNITENTSGCTLSTLNTPAFVNLVLYGSLWGHILDRVAQLNFRRHQNMRRQPMCNKTRIVFDWPGVQCPVRLRGNIGVFQGSGRFL